jgi:hypothetical protein
MTFNAELPGTARNAQLPKNRCLKNAARRNANMRSFRVERRVKCVFHKYLISNDHRRNVHHRPHHLMPAARKNAPYGALSHVDFEEKDGNQQRRTTE